MGSVTEAREAERATADKAARERVAFVGKMQAQRVDVNKKIGEIRKKAGENPGVTARLGHQVQGLEEKTKGAEHKPSQWRSVGLENRGN